MDLHSRDAPNVDLTGFNVEARDGKIGKVDEATHEAGGSFLVVDTGPWIFGKKVMLPAGMVPRIDPDTETVFVNLTKDEIKNAPEFERTPTATRATGTTSGATTAAAARSVLRHLV